MAGMARFAISRPGFPKMSPMNRIRTSVGPYRNAMLAAATLVDPRQQHAQLRRAQRRLGARDVERAGQSHGARETPERPLGDVKRRLLLVLAAPVRLSPGDHHRVPARSRLHRVGRHAHEVHDDLKAAGVSTHVEGHAHSAAAPGLIPHQLIEQTPEVVIQVAAFDKNAGHESILSLSAE